MGFLISVLIKFIIWYVRLMIWLVVALVVMTGSCPSPLPRATTGPGGRGRGRCPGSRCPNWAGNVPHERIVNSITHEFSNAWALLDVAKALATTS